jgi:transglutaminase-like putative cysteine protease
MKLRIQHRTTYRYKHPVEFGTHRMLLRPREGHDIHIEKTVLEITPAHRTRWIRDVYGNSIAVVDFYASASELVVYSEVLLNHSETNPFDFYIEPEAVNYPFDYSHETSLELSTLVQPAYPADVVAVREWLGQFWHPGQTVETLALIQQINGHINRTFAYQIRNEPGVQTPSQTISKGSGSCRDFATLIIEACRCLGLGARFVSGYLQSGGAPDAAASTHAWAEIYLPGGGWKGFDPTVGLMTASQHVAVAVSRHPENAMPISGSFIGPSSAFLDAEIDVRVEEIGVLENLPAPNSRLAQLISTPA